MYNDEINALREEFKNFSETDKEFADELIGLADCEIDRENGEALFVKLRKMFPTLDLSLENLDTRNSFRKHFNDFVDIVDNYAHNILVDYVDDF